MLARLRQSLINDHAIHVAGVQLALVVLLSASLAIAAAPQPRAMSLQAAKPAAAQLPAYAPQVEPVSDADQAADVIRLQDMTPDEARRWNAANPQSTAPNPAAKPFVLKTEGIIDEARAVDCMTAAIYYEAAYESTDGQRAVAQVVLNRMRNPIFPKTVCGVVFQGAERTTGCQFTFTCDGALTRGKPDDALWTRARAVATAALNGYVMKKVGNATHYHAVYVAPYWSPTLVKVQTIGAHIFYRWTGGAGLPPAFAGRYAGGESTGVKMATLDGLAKDKGKVTLVSSPGAEPSSSTAATQAAPAPANKDDENGKPAMTPTAAATQDASAILKAEELDWAGRPKQHGPPRIAIPGRF